MSRYKLEFNKILYYNVRLQLECNMHDFVLCHIPNVTEKTDLYRLIFLLIAIKLLTVS